jgi:adenylate cyclase
MMDEVRVAAAPPRPISFDGSLGQRIIALHVWAVEQGLRGAAAEAVFNGLCARLVAAGVPLWRAFAGMRTLHPQWAGYGLTWSRDVGAVELSQLERGEEYEQVVQDSPFGGLIEAALAPHREGDTGWPSLRRRLSGPQAQLDFPALQNFAAAGATDYFAQVVGYAAGDTSRGTGIAFSFAGDRPGGFSEDDLLLIQAVLPAASLAIMAEAGHMIAAGLLAAYLGADAGRRVHAGAVDRGSVESIRAVLFYADIRGFTAIADREPGLAVIEMLDEVFETVAAPLRARGAQVLKFLGDGILATFALDAATERETCERALAAAAEAATLLDRLQATRRAAGRPCSTVDFALHLGEVLYGNVGAVDRLDFTVIGPAVNEVARIELLCEPLGQQVLASATLAEAVGDARRLVPLGRHALRGVREPREIYAVVLGP